MPRFKIMPRGKRPPRATRSAATTKAINQVLLGATAPTAPAAQQPPPAVAGPSGVRPSFLPLHPRNRLGRPRPSSWVGVKRMRDFRRRNRDVKIKKLLPQSKNVNVKKKWCYCEKNDSPQA